MLSSHARRHLHVHLPFSMSGVHASRHTGLCMSVRMRRSQVLRHLVLLCVELHETVSCTSTPPSCVDTKQVKWLTPRPDPLDQATSSFSVDLRYFGSSGEFSSSDQSRIFFRSRSDELNILIDSKLSLTLRIKFPSLRFPEKFDKTETRFFFFKTGYYSVCPSAHTGRPWLSISTHISTLVLGLRTLTLPVDILGDFGPRGLFVQYTQDVCGCPPEHTEHPWLSVSTHRTSVAVRVCRCVSVSTHKTSVAVHQYTYQHAGPSCGLFGTLTLPVDCLGDFGQRELSVQYIHDVRECPLAHTGCQWLSVSVRVCPSMSVSTKDIRGYPSVHISARWSLESARWPFPWTVWVNLAHVGCLVSTHRTSVGVRQHTGHLLLSVAVRQHTQTFVAVCGFPSAHTGRLWLFVCVRVCPWVSPEHTGPHTGRLWLSISTHISTLVLGLSTLALPVDCLDDFGPRGLSVQYTQDGRGCPPAHTGHLWLSVAVRPHTLDVRGCPCVSMCVHVCPSAHAGLPWLSISTHISTLVLGLSTLALLVDCSGDFGPRGLSAQNTHDVCGCPSAHTGRPCVSVSTHRTSVAVRVCPCVSVSTHSTTVAVHQYISARWSLDSAHWPFLWTVRVCPSAHTGRPCAVCVCPSAHTRRPWLCISTHISTLVLGLLTLALPVDFLGDFGPRGMSVKYTQDVRGCLWLSVSTHRTSEAVRGCPSAHTGRLWLFVAVRQHTQDVCGCPCVSVSTHRTSVAVHQYTYQHAGPWTQHAGPCRGLFGLFWPTWAVCSVHTGRLWVSVSTHRRPCVSVSTHRTSVAVRVCPFMSVSTHRTTVAVHQYISARCSLDLARWPFPWTVQDVCGCPCVSVAVRVCLCVSVSTQRTSVAVHQYTYQHVGPWIPHADPSRGHFGTHKTSVAVHQYTYQHAGPWTQHVGPSHGLSGPHKTSVGVLQYTYQHAGPWTQHAGPYCELFGTHISTLVLGLSTLTLPVDCLGDFGQRELSVQYIHDVRGCPLAHTGCQWLSVSVRVCPSVSVSTQDIRCYTQDVCGCPPAHRTSVAVCGCPSAHTDVRGCLWLSVSTYRTSVAVRVCSCVSVYVRVCPWVSPAHTGRPWLSVSTHRTSVCVRKHTQDFRVCLCVSVSTHRTSVAVHQYTYQHTCPWTQHAGPSRGLFGTSVAVRQHTLDVRGCPCVSMCVRVCPSAHTGLPWLSISTHISTLALGLSTLALTVDCSGDFGSCGLSVQYTQDVRGCPPAHQDVCGCLTLTLPVDCSGDFGQRELSVQYIHDVRGCPLAHTGCQWLSVSVRVCPSMSVSTQDIRGYPSVHISARWSLESARWPFPWTIWVNLAHVGCLFSTHRTSVGVRQHTGHLLLSVAVRQHTQTFVAVCGFPSAHTGRLWLFVCVRVCPCVSVCVRGCRQNTQDVRGCPSAHTRRPCVFVSTHRTSVFVCVCPSAHTGRLWLSISTHISTLVLGLSTLALPVDCLGDFGPRGLSVQYTQDGRGYPPAHTGHLWLSVAVRQHTLDVCGCPCVSMCVHVCPSAHTGLPWLSISTHISTLVLGLSTLALLVDCSGDFGPRGLSAQNTHDVCGCPSAHTGRPCVSVSTHRTSVAVRVCPCVSVSTHRTTVAVHQYISARWSLDSARWPFLWTVRVILAHLGCLFSTHRTSVGIRQHTQDVRVRPQHTQDVCGCPCVSVCVRLHTHDVRGCPSVHISTRWSLV
ncbi:hypothetical protein IGI04_036376 [Brassica rapa subsp. trilocularis]|uniref:Uncharacterized protein n=1 Tax=Brassica rapa subsp. trilocularis TaxID=1813537 RepID=A0ABQ7LI54_BRACM|nr:hypothetical protein IGI04_036376 [Brassica rapa subsp. trilocularis]